jgi:antitoxin (DNA-binding transcriptional repressor) of toxin-antitoxin stability system
VTVTVVGNTSRDKVVLATSDPLVPVIVTLLIPATAAFAAVRLSALVVSVLVGVKLAVTPVGKPVADNVTVPPKPPVGVTVTVVLALSPGDTLALPTDTEKLGVPVLVPWPH